MACQQCQMGGNMSVKTCAQKFCPKFVIRQKNTIKKMTASFSKEFNMKPMNKSKKAKFNSQVEGRLKKACIKGYCNPTCKGTIFEAGKKYPKSLEITLKKKPFAIKFSKYMRQKIFGKKSNVLKNGFYNKIEKKNVNTIKKQGAISACSLKVL